MRDTPRRKRPHRGHVQGIPEYLAALIAEGRVTWSGRPFALPKRIYRLRPGPPVSDYIAQDR